MSAAAPAPAPQATSLPEPPNFGPPLRSASRLPVFVVTIVVVVLGVAGTIYLLGNIHSGNRDAGSGSVASPADALIRSLNLPQYPGSKPAIVSSNSTEEIIAAFQTRDTPQQVMGFYKIRFPVADTLGQQGQSELRATLATGEHIVVRAASQSEGTLVTIIRPK